ncbi:MAG: GvpL/GvpF family gas vesicle protein [Thermoplasmatales archaeon]|nr:GvpL/GvpF family gas vesicle protein [Thermoplasmatales archaeon]
MSNIYIYGIIKAKENSSFGPIGIDKNEVYTIRYQDIAALVSKTPSFMVEPTRENALMHEKVIREIMKECSVIPMGFGVIASHDEGIRKILEKGHKEFKAMLETINNRVQVDVKVSWDTNKVYADILNENKKIQLLKERVSKNPSARNLKIELGKMVKNVIDEKRNSYVNEIKNALGMFSNDSEENKLMDESMIMNISFLVDKDRENNFYDKVNELEKKSGGKLKIIAVGPLPAYNFTKMKIEKIDFNIIDNARKILGLDEEATMEEIENAHRTLAYRYHPDRKKGREKEFKKIEKAYALLINYCKHSTAPYSFRQDDVDHTIMIMKKSKR